MALAHTHFLIHVHHLLDNDCHVACSSGHARARGIHAEIDHSCQPLCHVLLLLLNPDDFCRGMGFRKLFDKYSAEDSHDSLVQWGYVQNDLYCQWMVLASPLRDHRTGMCGSIHSQLPDHCRKQVVF